MTRCRPGCTIPRGGVTRNFIAEFISFFHRRGSDRKIEDKTLSIHQRLLCLCQQRGTTWSLIWYKEQYCRQTVALSIDTKFTRLSAGAGVSYLATYRKRHVKAKLRFNETRRRVLSDLAFPRVASPGSFFPHPREYSREMKREERSIE